jgi:alanine racemase
MTHLASADDEDTAYTEKQIALYGEALALLHAHRICAHLATSGDTAGMHGHPQARGNLCVRGRCFTD